MSRAARLWEASLWAHAVGLLIALLALLWATNPSMAYTSDEGAAILQARHLEVEGRWIVDPVLPEVDPEQRAQPVPNASQGPEGRAYFAKRPLYPLVLLAAGRVFGDVG